MSARANVRARGAPRRPAARFRPLAVALLLWLLFLLLLPACTGLPAAASIEGSGRQAVASTETAAPSPPGAGESAPVGPSGAISPVPSTEAAPPASVAGPGDSRNPTSTSSDPPPVATTTIGPAAPSPSPVPTATPVAAPAASPAFSGQRAMDHVRWLSETVGSRPAGSSAGRRAAEGLADRLRGIGYDVQLQEFPIRYFEDRGSTLEVVGQPELKLSVRAMANTVGGSARGQLVDVGLGRKDDLVGRDLRGKVALALRGEIPFGEKAQNAASAGAIAVVVYNREPGPFRGVLPDQSRVPVVALSGEDGQRLKQRLAQGPVGVSLQANAATVETTSQNVVASSPASAPSGAPTLVLGAHYDSVADGPGANDNASGTATAIELARTLRETGSPYSVTVVLFGAEEIGLVGSRAYVASLSSEERDRIVAMLNLDMVGVGDRAFAGGSDELVDLAVEVARRSGESVARLGGGEGSRGSDHASFIQAGIPALFFYRGEDPRYHSPNDQARYVDPANLEGAARLALDVIGELASARRSVLTTGDPTGTISPRQPSALPS